MSTSPELGEDPVNKNAKSALRDAIHAKLKSAHPSHSIDNHLSENNDNTLLMRPITDTDIDSMDNDSDSNEDSDSNSGSVNGNKVDTKVS